MSPPGRRKKTELQSRDAGLTANDVTTDKQVQRFTNTIQPVADDRRGDFKE